MIIQLKPNTGIVNAELYTSDVAAVLRDNPSKSKYMRTMNNWVGWETKEYWYASEYTDDEAKMRTEKLRKKSHNSKNFKKRGHVAPVNIWWGVLYLMLAVGFFAIAVASVATAPIALLWVTFSLGFGGIVLALMSFMRALLLSRIGKVKYRPGEVIYEIKSILNRA